MFNIVIEKIAPSFKLLVLLTLIFGLGYPMLVTAIGQFLFPWQANGSLLAQQGKTIGSALIGQYFSEPQYFWGRISATQPYPYSGMGSAASNLALTNPLLLSRIKADVQRLQGPGSRPGNKTQATESKIPIDLVTASASGLDPEISPQAAYYQIPRIASARHIPESTLQAMVASHIKGRWLGVLGEPRLNVLELNYALDAQAVSKVYP